MTTSTPARLARLRAGRTISVCLPARDEEKTVGAIVDSVRRALVAGAGGVDLVDEVLVVDDGSVDGTAAAAAAAGARVVAAARRAGARARPCRWPWPRPGVSPRLPRRRRGELRAPFRDRAPRAGAHSTTTSALVKGFYRRPVSGGARRGRQWGRRPGDRAGGPARDRPALPACWPGSGSRWPGRRRRRGRCWRRRGSTPTTGSSWGSSSTWPTASGSRPWPRSTWGSGSTGTGPWTSCGIEATDVLRAALGRALPSGSLPPYR